MIRVRVVGRMAGISALGAFVALPSGCKDIAPTAEVDAAPPAASATATQAFSVPIVEAPPPPPPPPPFYAAGAADAGDFEGEIELSVLPYTGIPRIPVHLFVKGDRTAAVFQMTPGRGKSVTFRRLNDLHERRGYAVEDTSKTYEPYVLAPAYETSITRTGKMSKVAGGTCEEWEIVSSASRYHACVTRGLGPYMVSPDIDSAKAWQGLLAPDHYFALRASLVDANGVERQTVDVVRITRRAVDESILTFPASYQNAEDLEQQEAADAKLRDQ